MPGVKRPVLSERAANIVEMFVSRNIFPNAAQTVDMAISLLLEKQLQLESDNYEGHIEDYLVEEQLKATNV